LAALLDGAGSSVYNLGNSIGYSVRQVIDLVQKVTGRAVQTVEEQRRTGDPANLVADSGKIRRALNWAPGYEDLERIIATAWKWINR
jgi:UDP-glucose 4-epimerase